MQTATGKAAQGPVASELAAMFTFAVLPTIRKHYYDPNNPGHSWERYKKQCECFAAEAGIPKEERHRITVPCYISIDWDPRHTWLREFIATPGRAESARESCERALLMKDDAALVQEVLRLEQLVQDGPPDASDFSTLMSSGQRQHAAQQQGAWAQIVKAHADAVAQLEAAADARKKDAGEDVILHMFFDKSRDDVAFITITLEQYMPLSKVSPDVHSPIEHLVGTIKREVKFHFLEDGHSDEALREGRTYQVLINNAVRDRANGAAGRKHIRRSVDKQHIICKILAAPKGYQFSVRYRFGDEKVANHEVQGTAGAWIENTKWT